MSINMAIDHFYSSPVSFASGRMYSLTGFFCTSVWIRMMPLYLGFSCTIQLKDQAGSFVVESERSNAAIVITNESQWGEAMGKLLHMDLFPDSV